jgi:hypothetical protein
MKISLFLIFIIVKFFLLYCRRVKPKLVRFKDLPWLIDAKGQEATKVRDFMEAEIMITRFPDCVLMLSTCEIVKTISHITITPKH